MRIPDEQRRADSAAPIKTRIRSLIEAGREQTVRLAHDIHAQPQPAYAETCAADRLTTALDEAGFTVRAGVYGIPTAFVATTGPGPLHVALCAEYDAPPRSVLSDRSRPPGLVERRVTPDELRLTDHLHACGHNLIAGAAVAAGTALACVADGLGLRISVIGTPGEELCALPAPPEDRRAGGKVLLLDAGAFDDAHAALMVHPFPSPYGLFVTSRPYLRQRARFAATGEVGRRLAAQLSRLKDILGPALTEARQNPDALFIAPHDGAVDVDVGCYGRDLDASLAARELTRRCFEQTATAAGTEVDIIDFTPYEPMRNDPALREAYRRNAHALGRMDPGLRSGLDLRWRVMWWVGAHRAVYSTDLGNVSRRLPAIHPFIGIGPLVFPHSAEFAADTPRAAYAMIDGAIALAWTAADAALGPDLRSHLVGSAGQ